MRVFLKGRQWLIAVVLALLILAAMTGIFMTRNAAQQDANSTRSRRPPVVDERPLQTAQSVAKLTTGWDEQRYANQILRVADHEIDLAFADALRDATTHPAKPTPESQTLYTHLNKAQEQAKQDQDRIDELKKKLAAASGSRHDEIQQQIDLLQAQLELDQDDVDGARTDLIRSGADKLSRVQRQFKRHQDAEQAEVSHTPTAPPINYQSGTLWGQFEAWRALRGKIVHLQSASGEAVDVATFLTQSYGTLQQQLVNEKTGAAAAAEPSSSVSPPAHTTIAGLKVLADDQKSLADLNKRIQDMQDAQTAYGNWIVVLQGHQGVAVHGMIESALWILLIVLGAYLTDRAINHYLSRGKDSFTLFHTLRVVVRFAVQAVAVILILLVVFGIPQQMPTILGFAGAGLTVALKDFIVAFFGWFVLMGKNGIRVGDWVEINGVAGEVIEINLLRTVLLETGNGTTTGHPTGRKVNFVNSYAIEGHFFNFTTSGQWLWDELQYTISADRDPYTLLDAVQKIVAKETEVSVHEAEEEWQRETKRYRVRSISAAPAVTVQPTSSGVEIQIRYITRAHERYAMRARLNQAVMELLHRGVNADQTRAAKRS